MKLIRYRQAGAIKTGVIIDAVKYDTSGFGEDYNEAFFENNGLERLQQYIAGHKNSLQKIGDEVRLDAPVARPSKIICIGLNYADHAKETNATVPAEPVIFMKASTSWQGPDDDIMIPRGSEKTDWEVELAVVIGKKASYVEEAEAMDYAAGYLLLNDVSERAFQIERGGTWDKGKGCDTFSPAGPFLATKDEIADVDNLRLWLKVNGKIMQDGTTANLIFKLPYIISYVSQFMTLLPGDVISTGTPAGVGLGMSPQVYLKPGDVVELGIDGLGSSRQRVVAFNRQ
ncbi:ureidoglycolate lyase [Niabella ginsenosidivorans]|uniref:Ureidoglycolate lyase n=1 Tax=Niabella ginsenosidivorans TaxID=1176587 RepID=A0A1A9I3I8_9BACT|nr:fumarylacetoacetate hydrolase family protein [Niabella ginsenosidivorans]ANH81134.1 ureidoglycolate lyase [Niabella ginsenosidivorans]